MCNFRITINANTLIFFWSVCTVSSLLFVGGSIDRPSLGNVNGDMLPGPSTALLPLPRRQPANLPPALQQLNDKCQAPEQPPEKRNQQQDILCAGFEQIYRRFRFPPTLLQTLGPSYQPSFNKIKSRPPDPHPRLSMMKAMVDELVETSHSMPKPESPPLARFLVWATREEWLLLLAYVYRLLTPLETNLYRLGTQLLILGGALGYEDVLESVRRVLNQVFSQLPLTRNGLPVSIIWPEGHEGYDRTDEDEVGPRWLLSQVLDGIGLMRKKKEWETLCQGRLEVWRLEAARRGISIGD